MIGLRPNSVGEVSVYIYIYIYLFNTVWYCIWFKESFYKSKCPSVCPSVCVITFEVPFTRLFAPTSQNPMSKSFRDSESLGKINGNNWSQIWKLLLIKGVKSPRKKNVLERILPYSLPPWANFASFPTSLGEFFLTEHDFFGIGATNVYCSYHKI